MFGIDDAILGLGGAVAGVAGGAFGASAASGDREAARQAWEQSVKDYTDIGVPSEEAMRLVTQQYKDTGTWTPELEQAVKLGDSNYGGISTDPNNIAAQKQALTQLQDIGNSGGMTLSDRGQMEQQMGNLQAKERGSREAILQDAQQRGGYGSGAALAAQLSNQQNSSNQAHQDQLGIAAQAQSRALQAIQGAGQLGGQMQQQQFGEAAQKAQAQDAINQWNAQNTQAVQAANAGASNAARQYGAQNTQNVANNNTTTTNQTSQYNAGLPQQRFQDELSVAQGKGNARAGQASNLNTSAQQTANQWAGIGSGVGQAVAAGAQMSNNNDQAQKNRDTYLQGMQNKYSYGTPSDVIGDKNYDDAFKRKGMA